MIKLVLLSIFIVICILVAYNLPQQSENFTISKQIIKSVMSQTPSAIEVSLYNYRNQPVLLVRPSCCDNLSYVFTYDGQKMGSPFGGISGKGDGSMQDWYQQSKFIRGVYP